MPISPDPNSSNLPFDPNCPNSSDRLGPQEGRPSDLNGEQTSDQEKKEEEEENDGNLGYFLDLSKIVVVLGVILL